MLCKQKQLHHILSINPQERNGPQSFITQNNKPSNFGQSQFSLFSPNLAVSRPISHQNVSKMQNMVYSPAVKSQEDYACPNPMFSIPNKNNSQNFDSMLQDSKFTAAETNSSNNYSNLDSQNMTNSNHSLFSQPTSHLIQKPQTLKELLQLQRSFPVPSNQLQPPLTSSTQSPLIRGNYSSYVQPSVNAEMRSLFAPLQLSETPLQNTNLFGNHTQKVQHSETKAFICKIVQYLKKQSERKIKSDVSEIILKLQKLELLDKLGESDMLDLQSLIEGTEISQNYPLQYPINHQAPISKQNMPPLTCNFPMNTIPDVMQYKPCPQPMNIEATRKNNFSMNEIPIAYQSTTNTFPRRMMQGNLFQPNQGLLSDNLNPLSSSPTNVLEKEMNMLSLGTNMNYTQFPSFGITQTVPITEKIEDFPNIELCSFLKQKLPSNESLPGVYTKEERINKILKYKNKIRKWRKKHPVKRTFKGRKEVAVKKLRVKGKFVTKEMHQQYQYQQYLHAICKTEEIFKKEEDI